MRKRQKTGGKFIKKCQESQKIIYWQPFVEKMTTFAPVFRILMYCKTLISLAFYGILCLLSFVERKAEECTADNLILRDVETIVITSHPEASGSFYASPASFGASASEVNNQRSSRMPVKRNHIGSFMLRSRVCISTLSHDMDLNLRMLLFPSGTSEAAHHLIRLRKLII